MKKSVFVVSLILLSFLLQTCRDDNPVNTGNVQFAFSANEESFIGPPSPAAMDELRELRDIYGWTIYPQVDF